MHTRRGKYPGVVLFPGEDPGGWCCAKNKNETPQGGDVEKKRFAAVGIVPVRPEYSTELLEDRTSCGVQPPAGAAILTDRVHEVRSKAVASRW